MRWLLLGYLVLEAGGLVMFGALAVSGARADRRRTEANARRAASR